MGFDWRNSLTHRFLPLGLTYSTAISFVLIAGTIVAAICDLRTRLIPNSLVLLMLILGLVLSFGATGLEGLRSSAFGAVLGLAMMLPGYLLRAMGAGDVKLMAAVGALVGPGPVVQVVLWTLIFGGGLSIAVLTKRRFDGHRHDDSAVWPTLPANPDSPDTTNSVVTVPYAPAIVAGSLFMLYISS